VPFLTPNPTRIGLVCLARRTFDVDLAAQWYERARETIGRLPGLQLAAMEKMVVETEDAEAAIAELRTIPIDALILISGTFALGGLATQLAQAFPVPLLLWAWPEPEEHHGRLRLNSLVGMTVNASNLYKRGYRPLTLYAAVDDPRAAEIVTHLAQVAGILRDLRCTRIGLVGGHAAGFDNLAVDKLLLRRRLGVEVIDIGLDALIARARAVPPERVQSARDQVLRPFGDRSELTLRQADLYTALVLALEDLGAEGFDGLAVKCWGDLVEAYGIAACGAVARLTGEQVVLGCEGDVLGTLTALIAQRLTGIPAFLSDLVSVERERNEAFFWHIGCAPLALANPDEPAHLFAHFAGGHGVTAGFGLRPGRVTVLRLGDDGRGNLRALAATGTALTTRMEVRGTVVRVALDQDVSAFLDRILSEGWEHHLVVAYGDILPPVEMLCRLLDVPLVQ